MAASAKAALASGGHLVKEADVTSGVHTSLPHRGANPAGHGCGTRVRTSQLVKLSPWRPSRPVDGRRRCGGSAVYITGGEYGVASLGSRTLLRYSDPFEICEAHLGQFQGAAASGGEQTATAGRRCVGRNSFRVGGL